MTEYRITATKEASQVKYGVTAYIMREPVRTIPDVFQSLEDAQNVVELLNAAEVELCHLEDIIEDYLTDFSI